MVILFCKGLLAALEYSHPPRCLSGGQGMTEPRSIELELRWLRARFNDAEWEQDEGMMASLSYQINRLEMLQSLGERFDVPF
jgi:hypothetical protein